MRVNLRLMRAIKTAEIKNLQNKSVKTPLVFSVCAIGKNVTPQTTAIMNSARSALNSVDFFI